MKGVSGWLYERRVKTYQGLSEPETAGSIEECADLRGSTAVTGRDYYEGYLVSALLICILRLQLTAKCKAVKVLKILRGDGRDLSIARRSTEFGQDLK